MEMGDSKPEQAGGQHKCKCKCARRRKTATCKLRDRDRCVRMRQTLVCNASSEGSHFEPYMGQLHEEFSRHSALVKCTPGVELPWDEIAIDPVEIGKLHVRRRPTSDDRASKAEEKEIEEKTCDEVELPWEELLVTDTVHAQRARKELERCDSSLEIPWHDILYDHELKRQMQSEPKLVAKTCDDDNIEIPWDDLLIPTNIVIAPSKKYLKKKPRSSENKCGCARAKH